MADPNLPQDMQQTQPHRRKKQLPSLHEGGGGTDEGAALAAPPRRLKKLGSTAPPAAALGESTATGPEEAAAAAATTAPKPRKKKRPQQSATTAAGGGAGESSPDHGTAPISAQQQLLPATQATEAEASPAAAPAGGRPRRKTRRPKAAATTAAEEDARRSPDGREADAADAAGTGTAASPQRTRYIDVEGMPLAKALETVREDVVTRGGERGGRVNFAADLTDGDDGQPKKRPGAGDDDEDEVGGGGGGGGRPAGESNMSDTIFWQTQDARTFRAEKLDKYQQRLEQERKEREQYLEGVVEEDTSNRTLKCAIGFTRVYNYIGTILLGLMPGFALLHTGYVWSLSGSYRSFLADYSSLSGPLPILYYVVLTLIMLSVLDRYDTGKLDRKSCLDCASFRHAGMVILLYVPAYVVSNAMYPTDQWIRRYGNNATAYAGLASGDGLVQSWRIMDAVRAACLVLGWLVVAFNPQFNRLATNLETELDDLIGEEQRMEMGTAAPLPTGTMAATAVATTGPGATIGKTVTMHA